MIVELDGDKILRITFTVNINKPGKRLRYPIFREVFLGAKPI